MSRSSRLSQYTLIHVIFVLVLTSLHTSLHESADTFTPAHVLFIVDTITHIKHYPSTPELPLHSCSHHFNVDITPPLHTSTATPPLLFTSISLLTSYTHQPLPLHTVSSLRTLHINHSIHSSSHHFNVDSC